MLAPAAALFIASLLALAAAWRKSHEARRDEGRMAGYIASLRAVANGHRQRILDLETALASSEQLLRAQDRLLEGQAAHIRTLDVDYAG